MTCGWTHLRSLHPEYIPRVFALHAWLCRQTTIRQVISDDMWGFWIDKVLTAAIYPRESITS